MPPLCSQLIAADLAHSEETELAARLAALSPKREPARPTAAEEVAPSDAEVLLFLPFYIL